MRTSLRIARSLGATAVEYEPFVALTVATALPVIVVVGTRTSGLLQAVLSF
jgi:hypothetical protein